MCCLINEMVTCVDNIGCGAMMTDVLTPLKGQLSSICGDYSYTEGCSAAFMSAVPSLSLMAALIVLLRFYN